MDRGGGEETPGARGFVAARRQVRRRRADLVFLADLRRLPPRVGRFQWRARRLAVGLDDEWSILSATRPVKLAVLLELARGATNVVELGTATGWTALSLLLADPRRKVTSYDVEVRRPRERYLGLAGSAATRLKLIEASGESGPRDTQAVDFLYVDSSHSRDGILAEFHVWRPVLKPDALVVFDDFDHPSYPGVREAVEQLELAGVEREGLYIHRILS